MEGQVMTIIKSGVEKRLTISDRVCKMATEGVLQTMWVTKFKIGMTIVLVVAAGLAQGKEKASSGFSLAEFKQLKAKLDVKNQPWANLPWQVSLTEARELAAKTKKPIVMMAGTGTVLGWG
jgi:hypothetical protein